MEMQLGYAQLIIDQVLVREPTRGYKCTVETIKPNNISFCSPKRRKIITLNTKSNVRNILMKIKVCLFILYHR